MLSCFSSAYLASGAQKEFTVTDKYTRKKTISNWGKPCIWLNNENPLEYPGLQRWQRDYIEGNCKIVHLDHRLYTPDPIIPPMFHPRPLPPIPDIQEDFIHPDVEPMNLQGVLEEQEQEEEEEPTAGGSGRVDKGKAKERPMWGGLVIEPVIGSDGEQMAIIDGVLYGSDGQPVLFT